MGGQASSSSCSCTQVPKLSRPHPRNVGIAPIGCSTHHHPRPKLHSVAVATKAFGAVIMFEEERHNFSQCVLDVMDQQANKITNASNGQRRPAIVQVGAHMAWFNQNDPFRGLVQSHPHTGMMVKLYCRVVFCHVAILPRLLTGARIHPANIPGLARRSIGRWCLSSHNQWYSSA